MKSHEFINESKENSTKYYNLGEWKREARKLKLQITVGGMAGAMSKAAKIYYADGEHAGGYFYLYSPNNGEGSITVDNAPDIKASLNEYAIVSGDGGGGDDSLFDYAKMWYNGDLKTQRQVEKALHKIGLDIGENEDENGGAYISDSTGDYYESWTAAELGKDLSEDIVDEMALKQYQPVGNFDTNGPLKGADRPLATHSAHIQKVEQFFERTPYDFRIFVSNLTGLNKYRESGAKSPEQLAQMFAKDKNYQEVATQVLADTKNAITIIYLGNYGDAKVLLTPWVMAHRLGHAIAATNRESMGGSGRGNDSWSQAERYFFKTINTLLSQHYGKLAKDLYSGANVKWDLTPEYNALFNAIGTQRSSRKGLIKRPYEFIYELFAQYIKNGSIKLNPLPIYLGYGRKVFGNYSKHMRINTDYVDDLTRQEESDRLAATLSQMFKNVLSTCVGKIFVM